MPNDYLVTIMGAAFAAALLCVYWLARIAVNSNREAPKMADDATVSDVEQLLKNGMELAGVATALDVQKRVADAAAAIAAYQAAITSSPSATVASGTFPVIVPHQ